MTKRPVLVITSLITLFCLGCSANPPAATTTGPTGTLTVPAAPTGVTATGGDAQVSVAWAASSGATSYNIYYSLNAGVTAGTGTKISGITATAYTQMGLVNGSTYYYVVTAVNGAGESAASAQSSAKPLAALPAAPGGVTAAAGIAQVVLSWSAVPGATTYNIYYGTNPALSTSNGTKVGAIAGTTYTISGLVNGAAYYFLVTAVNATGEGPGSAVVSATPSNGTTVALVPGSAATATLQATATASIGYTFPAGAVSANAMATINPVAQSALTVGVPAGGAFVAGFTIALNPSAVGFNVPVGIAGSVGGGVPAGTTLLLAMLQNGAWVNVGSLLTGTGGGLGQNMASVALPGLLSAGTYLIYQPGAGTNTSVSNLGEALFTDGASNVQVVHLYDTTGAVLAAPTISTFSFSGTNDLTGLALGPDGSQGIAVGALRTARFFSGLQSGSPATAKTVLDLSSYGGNSDAVAMLPNGDEAVITTGSANQMVVVSGILSGAPVAATTIPVTSAREGVVISSDGKVLLARNGGSLSVYSITAIAPKVGALGGTISHAFTQLAELPVLGSVGDLGQGRTGMAVSPTDSTRGVVIRQYTQSTIQVVTGLTSTSPVAGTYTFLPMGDSPYTVAISLDGKLAVVGAKTGLLLYQGVNSGTLSLVGTSDIGTIQSLGITLDGKYVVAVAVDYKAIAVVPFSATGFAAPVGARSLTLLPGNDQLIIH